MLNCNCEKLPLHTFFLSSTLVIFNDLLIKSILINIYWSLLQYFESESLKSVLQTRVDVWCRYYWFVNGDYWCSSRSHRSNSRPAGRIWPVVLLHMGHQHWICIVVIIESVLMFTETYAWWVIEYYNYLIQNRINRSFTIYLKTLSGNDCYTSFKSGISRVVQQNTAEICVKRTLWTRVFI